MDKIGYREVVAILLFSIGLKLSNGAASLVLREAVNASWMVPFLSGFMITLPYLAVLSLVKRHRNLGLIEIGYKLLGKLGGLIIGFILFLNVLTSLVSFGHSYAETVHTNYYPKTPFVVSFSIFAVIGYYLANRGIEAIGRTAWILLWPLKFFILLLAVMSLWILKPEIDYLFPIAGPGVSMIFAEGFTHIGLFSEVIFLSVLYPYVKSDKDYRKGTVLGFIFGGLEIAFFYFLYITIFGTESVRYLTYPFQEMTRILTAGPFLPNIDAFYFLIWSGAAFIRFAVYLYLLAFLFGETFHIKEFEPLILPLSAFVVLLGMIAKNGVIVQKYLMEGTLSKIFIITLLVIPLVLWVVDRLKGKMAS